MRPRLCHGLLCGSGARLRLNGACHRLCHFFLRGSERGARTREQRDADQWSSYFGSVRPDGWWALYSYAEGIPEWLQEMDAGLKSRVLETITEPTWHTLRLCRDLSKFSDIIAMLDGNLGQNLAQTRRKLYRMTFEKSYEELVALGRPLQELSGLCRERVQM